MGDGGRAAMARQSRRLRTIAFFLMTFSVFYCMIFVSRSSSRTSSSSAYLYGDEGDSKTPLSRLLSPSKPSVPLPRKNPPPHVLRNLSLTAEECEATFPGLTKEIDDVVKLGPFVVKQTGDLGPLQGRIKDGKITVIHAQRRVDLSQEMLNSRTAALHQLHRALLTAPSPLPDTIFTLNFQDQPFGTSWSFSRAADPLLSQPSSSSKPGSDPHRRIFPMPHFSFWAWPLPFINSMYAAAESIARIEHEYTDNWLAKNRKAVWRGTTWFNGAHAPHLRHDLLRVARGQPWADVQSLNWTETDHKRGTKIPSNAIPIHEFCRYRYILHTEGVTYSGRFQYLQMCKSVILTPPIQWMQHTTHLVRPLFSNTLDFSGIRTSQHQQQQQRGTKERSNTSGGKGGGKEPSSRTGKKARKKENNDKKGGRSWIPTPRILRSWPHQYPPEQANMVFVAPDWSDLAETIAWLEAHPRVAEGIARRQRELFVGGGYFSPAAETCYWRALVRGWAGVADVRGQGWEEAEGVSYEEFTLPGK